MTNKIPIPNDVRKAIRAMHGWSIFEWIHFQWPRHWGDEYAQRLAVTVFWVWVWLTSPGGPIWPMPVIVASTLLAGVVVADFWLYCEYTDARKGVAFKRYRADQDWSSINPLEVKPS